MKKSFDSGNNFALCIFIIVFFLSGAVSAYSAPLKVGVLNFPPYYIVKDMDHVEGIFINVLTKTLKLANMPFTIKGYPPKRLYTNVATGKTDIWLGTKGVPVYEGKVLYSKDVVSPIELRMYTIGDTKPPESKDELKGKNILTIRGYGYGGLIKFLKAPANKIELDPSSSHETAFKKLINKRAKYLLDYKHPSDTVLKNHPIKNLHSSSLKKINCYFVVSKKNPDAEKIMQKLEKAYSELKAAGEL